jgi:tRNA/rRNA methyltransferase
LNIIFILVNPAVPANVGAAARAIKTMGFSELRLVNPCDHLGTEARMLAHASDEILENARVFSSLAEAAKDIDLVIGATARRRTKRVEYVRSNLLSQLILEKGKSVRNVAMVFGSEESGLSNEDAALCDILTSISMATKYPSLNLAQAVMVYAYELSPLAGRKLKTHPRKEDKEGWKALKTKTETLLDNIGMTENDLIRTRIMERFALLGETDVHLLHSIIARLNKKGYPASE